MLKVRMSQALDENGTAVPLVAQIVKARKDSGDTQSKIARHAGWTPGYLSHVINGIRTNVSDDKASRLADVLQVPVELLFLPESCAADIQAAS